MTNAESLLLACALLEIYECYPETRPLFMLLIQHYNRGRWTELETALTPRAGASRTRPPRRRSR